MLQSKDYLEIEIEGRKGTVKLFIHPQTSNAKLFEDNEQLYGKAKHQLVEGNTYVYEFSDPNELTSLQFSKELIKVKGLSRLALMLVSCP